jgi:endogenous inhibitor of DNA gyrase (YacG/DUF329 family)
MGELFRSWSVYCSDCGRHEYWGDDNKYEAAEMLDMWGWVGDEDSDWLCPDCAKKAERGGGE